MAYLKEIRFNWDKVESRNRYPFDIPSLKRIKSIYFKSNVTFFVGENGSGKSTLLEAIAQNCGFCVKGGSRNSLLTDDVDDLSLSSILTLAWLPKVSNGFLLRAETFYDYASYIDSLGPEAYASYGGKSLHMQSHGESFLSLLQNRFGGKGIYLLDEPEAALSPQRQLVLLRIIRQLEKDGKAQFIIATHSPILMAYPDADIYSFDHSPIIKVQYEETEHYQVTRGFLNNRDKVLEELFSDD
ncbi:SMC domain protein [Ruminiclostridium papyrosolvens DSM 2782]|uniref:SMC domain protein n=1 Tax=Ruminiclostridium papyrosolvens DSM 2782 TaxID=588581 RepID=F1THC4_9FIRM|nr:AAA family ATPase [Ruminiclostridium papyrosolvens]EGD46127.1 SMC domain protein [Ruminiclostridium papyrosolvens DSM 2782]WES35912.1 AAA family ATPase [Ruminiclostridium papyrosolvens DSM 2782]